MIASTDEFELDVRIATLPVEVQVLENSDTGGLVRLTTELEPPTRG